MREATLDEGLSLRTTLRMLREILSSGLAERRPAPTIFLESADNLIIIT